MGHRRKRNPFARFVEPLEPRVLLAAALVKDINPTDHGLTSAYYKIGLDGGGVLAWTSAGMYRVDGTADGAATRLVQETGYTDWPRFTRSGGLVYFLHRATFNGPTSLWRTDGTAAGTFKLLEPTGGATIGSLHDCNGTLYFGTRGSPSQLWKSDGTLAGTTAVRDFAADNAPTAMAWYNGKVYFAATPSGQAGLWSSDGTSAGTTFVKAMQAGSITGPFTGQIVAANGLMYFTAYDSTNGEEPWRSDGTAAGTHVLRNVATGSSSSFPTGYMAVGNSVVFVANGYLWATQNGTTAARISGFDVYSVSGLTKVGNTVYFKGHEYDYGEELYRTDGTAAGTVKVKEIGAGGYGAYINELTAADGRLYFYANDGTGDGPELWRSDGTDAGTVKFSNLPGTTAPNGLAASGTRVFFTATDPMHGSEIHVSDGTPAGTRLAANLVTTPSSSNPGGTFPAVNYWAYRGNSWTATVGGTTFFPASGGQLWKSDGTTAGTVAVKDDFQSYYQSPPAVRYLTAWKGAVYFYVEATVDGGIWRSDGTKAGTVRLAQASLDAPSGAAFVPFKGELYFFANSGALFKTDGTPAGTVDVTSGTVSMPYPNALAAAGDHLFFRAGWDSELWVSDGTAAGTHQLKDINPGSSHSGQQSIPDEFVALGDTIYFTAEDTTNSYSRGLWKSDGTAEGTVPVMREITPTSAGNTGYKPAGLTVVGDTIYFAGFTWEDGWELWTSDGTTAGTARLKQINPLTGNDISSSPQWFTPAADGRVYFAARLPETGHELWVTDGTAAGTFMVHDTRPGPLSSFAPDPNRSDWAEQPIMTAGDLAFFVADDGVSGRELWQTSGTFDTTGRVTDLVPGATPSNPHLMGVAQPGAGGAARVLFAADSPDFGRELFGADAVALPAAPPSWLNVSPGADYRLGAQSLEVSGGTVAITGSPAATHPVLDVTARGAGNVVFDVTSRLRGLTLADTAIARVPAGRNAVLILEQLAVGTNARLDLADNDLILHYTGASPIGAASGATYTGITALLQSGYHGGDWSGAGLVTSMPDAPTGLTTLAIGEASNIFGITGTQTATWNGHTVDATTVIVKYTYGGDTNFDGKLDADDYGTIDFNVLLAGPIDGYYNGDFNFDGKVDADDYGVIDFNILAQDGVL